MQIPEVVQLLGGAWALLPTCGSPVQQAAAVVVLLLVWEVVAHGFGLEFSDLVPQSQQEPVECRR
eukprot:2229153-Heterocapsa_arctica.AAC.1